MSEAALAAPDRGERLHPLYLVTGLGKVVNGAWGVLAGGAYLAVQDKLGLALILFGAFVAFSLVSLLGRWLTFEFRVEDDQLRIEQGLLNRSSRTIPFDRVTDVDIEQGPVHRLFGLARVRMETGASASAKEGEGLLDTIALDRAQEIREFVRARRGSQSTPVIIAPANEVTTEPLFAMDTRRVVTAGLFNFSLAVIAALFGASQTIGQVVGFDPFSRAFWLNAVASAGPLREYVLAHRFVAAIGGTVVLLAIGIGTGLVRTVLREHGFRLERTDSGFRRRRGLLTLTDVTIPARRVQATILATGPIKRAFGWFVLKLQSLAMDGGQGSHVVAPLASIDEASTIQQSLHRPMTPDEAHWRPLPIGHFLSGASIFAIGTAIGLALAVLLSPLALLAVAGLGVAALVNWLEWRRSRHALDGDYLFIDRGWWRQRLAIVPVARIQSIDLAESFWTRTFGFVRMRFGIAGGSMLSAFTIDAISRADAEALRNRLVAP